MTLGSFDDDFGIILGSIWNHVGIILELFWNHLGMTLGSFWMGGWTIDRKRYPKQTVSKRMEDRVLQRASWGMRMK